VLSLPLLGLVAPTAPFQAHDTPHPVKSSGVGQPADVPPCDPVGPFGLPGSHLPPDQIGAWGPVVPWPVQATHATVLHTGKILFWREGEAGLGDPTITYLWDPATQALQTVNTPSTEMFCSGHASLADGRIIAGGGTLGGELGWGPVDTNLFDPVTETWTRVANMNYGRYYATLTTLGDGRVVAISGTVTPGHWAAIPEVYDPAADLWTPLYDAGNVMNVYPHSLLIPDGRVLYSGPSSDTQALDLVTGTWQALPNAPFNNILGSTVQYEPGKIMKATGGSGPNQTPFDTKTQIIDMNEPSPSWVVVGPTNYARGWVDFVLLADGKVLLVGGAAGGGNSPECAVHAPEMWDPETKTWTIMASHERSREYHSTTILLPDGRVLAAGGENLPLNGELNYQIYSPPYLFKGPRPVVEWAPGAIGFGDTFAVQTPAAASIAKVGLLRPNSVTHAFDENQRYVPLKFTVDSANTLNVIAPPHENVAPVGYYLLFLLDASGVPSIGRSTRLGSCTASADGEASCDNRVDDDCDGLTDRADLECGPVSLPFAPAGAIPDGAAHPGAPLSMFKVPDGRILLSWSPSCSAGDSDYAIYEGTIGDWNTHIPVFCSTNGATWRVFGRVGDNYYLVVPRNDVREGSYGLDSQGNERPPSPMACRPQEVGACLPADPETPLLRP
jgi:hypothetical protein